jgi:hypothetical protein
VDQKVFWMNPGGFLGGIFSFVRDGPSVLSLHVSLHHFSFDPPGAYLRRALQKHVRGTDLHRYPCSMRMLRVLRQRVGKTGANEALLHLSQVSRSVNA